MVYEVLRMNIELWDFLPKSIETLERSYNLLKEITEDLVACIKLREKSRIEAAVRQLRNQVGEIDSIFSKIRAKMQVALDRNDTTWYSTNKKELEKARMMIVMMSSMLLDTLSKMESKEPDFMNEHSKLRDALHLKLESEGIDDLDKPTEDEARNQFIWWVNYSADATRNALELLNEELKDED